MYGNSDDQFNWRIVFAFLLIVAANGIAGYTEQKRVLQTEISPKKIHADIKLTRKPASAAMRSKQTDKSAALAHHF